MYITTVLIPNTGLELELRSIRIDGTDERTLIGHISDGNFVAFAPDRLTFAYITDDHELVRVRMDGSGNNVVAKDVFNFAWAANSKKFAYVSRAVKPQIYTIAADGSDRRRLTNNNARRMTGSAHPYHTLAWSVNGGRIAFTSQRADWKRRPLSGRLYTMRSDGKRLTQVRGLGNFVLEELAWSPVRPRLAVGGVVDAGVRVIRSDGRTVARVAGTRSCMGVGVNWSPDGSRLAFFGGDTSAGYPGGVADLARSRATIFTQFAGPISHPAWSRPGSRLAFLGCNNQGACSLYVADRNGRNVKRVPNTRLRTFDGPVTWAK
jgi:Tol biopolymer transport system component